MNWTKETEEVYNLTLRTKTQVTAGMLRFLREHQGQAVSNEVIEAEATQAAEIVRREVAKQIYDLIASGE